MAIYNDLKNLNPHISILIAVIILLFLILVFIFIFKKRKRKFGSTALVQRKIHLNTDRIGKQLQLHAKKYGIESVLSELESHDLELNAQKKLMIELMEKLEEMLSPFDHPKLDELPSVVQFLQQKLIENQSFVEEFASETHLKQLAMAENNITPELRSECKNKQNIPHAIKKGTEKEKQYFHTLCSELLRSNKEMKIFLSFIESKLQHFEKKFKNWDKKLIEEFMLSQQKSKLPRGGFNPFKKKGF